MPLILDLDYMKVLAEISPAVDQMWSIATQQLMPALEDLYAAVQQLNMASMLQDVPQMVQSSGICEFTVDSVSQLSSSLGVRLAAPHVAAQLPRGLHRKLPRGLHQQLPRGLHQQLPRGLDQQLPRSLDQQLPRGLDQQLLPSLNSIKQWFKNTFKYLQQKIAGESDDSKF